MERLSNWDSAKEGLPLFVKELGRELDVSLRGRAEVGWVSRSKTETCYSLIWVFDHFSGDVLISFARDSSNPLALTIDRFLGVDTGAGSYLPQTLRNVAQMYDDVRAFVEQKFGDPVSVHDGRAIYRATLPKAVVVENSTVRV